MAECSICCEKFNKTYHKNVICNYCTFSCCRTCVQKYFLESSLDPHCMGCKKFWGRDFINENCTNVFITGDFKKHRENILLEREKCLMPETQPYVIVEKEREKLRSQIPAITNEISKLYTKIAQKKASIDELVRRANRITVNNLTGEEQGSSKSTETTERKKFVRKCPMNECKGFLSSQWKCGLCETKICNKCNEEKLDTELDADGNHNCKPENVASMELLNKDTKPCPSCGTMIYKISGCDQMWCPDCHTAFSWLRGTIERGVVHNPHYYDFMRSTPGGLPRNQGDVVCGNLPELYQVRVAMNTVKLSKPVIDYIFNMHNSCTHIRAVMIRDLPNYIVDNRNLRVEYLMDKVSEQQLKIILQQREKEINKRTDFNNIYQMFYTVCTDVYIRIIDYVIENRDAAHRISNKCLFDIVHPFIEEQVQVLRNLVIYFNEHIKKLGKFYKCVTPGINSEAYFQQNYETYLRRVQVAETLAQRA